MGASEKDVSKFPSHKTDRKVGMSCAECRRSKLKCDRTFPCSACVRRGCANICPDGILAATKGNKVLQTQNETLLHTVKRMTTRIRDLEAALSNTQAQISPQPHPLLQDGERLKETDARLYDDAEPSRDEAEEASDLVGSLSIGDQGQTRFHGQSSASEFLQTLLPGAEDDLHALHSGNMYKMGLPLHIIELINAFPFNVVTPGPDVKSDILRFLPQHSKALALALAYFENAGCSFLVVQQEVFIPSLLQFLLQVTNGLTIGENLHSHQVAVIYLIIAIGSHLSENGDGEADGEKYYHLACAAMSLNPLVKEATSTTLQALFIMVQYFNYVDSPSCERRWLMSGIMFRLAYSIGLQRDPGLWDLSPEETQRRRILFWEMYTWDAWNSILYGRPPSLNITYTDCRFPEDKSSIFNAKGEREMGFEAYKYRFAAFILAPVLDRVFGVRELNYGALLEVDIKLRRLPPPSWLLSPTRGKGEPVDGRAWNANSMQAMQQYCMVCTRESTLLYIHRRYFATAIKLNSADPLKTKYGASVMAACRSACILLSGLRSLYGVHPKLASKQSFFWSGAFSACIVLGCLVYNSPGCSLANDALRAIDDGVELYSMRVFEDSASSVKLLASVRNNVHRMFEKYHNHPGDKDCTAEHGLDCATMRVLEGNTVLINLNDVKARIPSASASGTGSTPGLDVSSPSSRQDSPAEPLERGTPLPGPQARVASTWSGNRDDSDHDHAIPAPAPDYRMFDFSGLHNGSMHPQFQPSSSKSPTVVSHLSVYRHVDAVAEAHPGAQTERSSLGASAEAGPAEGLAGAQAYSMFGGFGAGLLPTDESALPPYAGLGIQYAGGMASGFEPPDVTVHPGSGGVGGVSVPAEGMYDQPSWEKFLGEMGIPNPGT